MHFKIHTDLRQCALSSYLSFNNLPVSVACGCGSWLCRRASLGWVENGWPRDPRSTKGRSKVEAQEDTASRAWSDKAGLIRAGRRLTRPRWHRWRLYVCLCVHVCVWVGRGKGGGGFNLGLCLNLVCSGTAENNREGDKRARRLVKKHNAWTSSITLQQMISL